MSQILFHQGANQICSEPHLHPLCPQAKDSDDDEEVVQVDRDHFMDEFFEQVRPRNTDRCVTKATIWSPTLRKGSGNDNWGHVEVMVGQVWVTLA